MGLDGAEFDNESEYDENFVRTGYVLIEEGIDANGEHAFRFRHTVPRPMALGLMQVITDHMRYQEQRTWIPADQEDDEEEDDD